MMTREEAMAKVAKLLKLAKSDNPHEAAVAAGRAQEIMDRYRLQGAPIDLDGQPATPEEVIGTQELDEFKTQGVSFWRGRLATVIAHGNQCDVFGREARTFGHSALMIVGRPSDVATVRYLYAYLTKEIERLTRKCAPGKGRVWASNFRAGCVDTIKERLTQQRAETTQRVVEEAQAESPAALARVTVALAKRNQGADELAAYMAQQYGGRIRTQTQVGRGDDGARQAGRTAAQDIPIGTSKGGIGAGRLTLGTGT